MAPRSKYPWLEWTDGSTWQIYKHDDYQISTYNMQISLHARAKTQGIAVSTRSFTERERAGAGQTRKQEGLIFQFYNKDDE